MTPRPRTNPVEWAKNRFYPATAGKPGQRDPYYTPYTVPVAMAIHGRTHKRVVLVVSAQSGKSETMLDVMGERLDTSPVPILYVGPSKRFLQEQWYPRMDDLMENTPLKDLLAPKSHQRMTRRVINGVPVRLAHGGSSGAMKSDPFGLALTDEADELMKELKGQGNPIGNIDARGDSYSDFVHAITSTPSQGVTEVERDPETGLEFWADSDPEEISSTIWRLWLTGTRYHWAWPCPHCEEFFIPRFSCLEWEKPKDDRGRELQSNPALAKRTAHLMCPNCGTAIEEGEDGSTKTWMNERGVYVAPGQGVDKDGTVHGYPPDSTTLSYWVSGLCSPMVSWGERAQRYVEAVRSGNPADIQSVKNQGFGELYSPGGGAAPEWGEVQDRASPDYDMGEVPDGVRILTLTADVQKDRIYYVIRGWGAYGTSWLVKAEELYGLTEELEVWNALSQVVTDTYDDIPIRLALVDSGFRPGKKFVVPEHRVYAFAHRHPHLVRPTKGSSSAMRKPIVVSKLETNIEGKDRKQSIELMRLDTDFFKSWVQQKVRWLDDQPGSWYLPSDISEDYCRQIVSEARVRAPGGKVRWIQKSKENHFFDCEAMQGAAQLVLNLSKLRDGAPQRRRAVQEKPEAPAQAAKPSRPQKPEGGQRSSTWGGHRGSIW